MGWPLEARRSLFPDWLWLCTVMSHHCTYRRALQIPVQILAGKFKMEFLPTVSCINLVPATHDHLLSHRHKNEAAENILLNSAVANLLLAVYLPGSR